MSMGSSSSMKVHTFARGFWDTNNTHQQQIIHDLPSLSLGCKRFRPLAPKLNANNVNVNVTGNGNSFDLKSFIKPENEIRKFASYDEKRDSASHHHVQSVETHPGGTRWNPTQEQIGILEMLYKGGMRTPNAQQIEQITEQLAKYGKIEGKNVFYWFQNHKARERQKQKRNILGLTLTTTTTTPTTPTSHNDASILALSFDARVENEQKQLETSPYKRKLREWTFEYTTEDNNVKKKNQDYEGCDQTLELFPLHPERR